ncbi:MAG: bifunctional heptose 7-phosphate kinase/heptose 1-phosphate adenyltransferase [Longimicrobiales bacterium]
MRKRDEPSTQLDHDRLTEILQAARDVRILVVGDLMLDRYISGRVDRISPEAPVPVVRVDSESSAIGGAANVAANVVALGARCEIIGCLGRDAAGEDLRLALEDLGVGTGGTVRADGRPTSVKTRILARRQQVVRFDHEDDTDVPAEIAEELEQAVDQKAVSCDAVVLEDYNKGVLVESVIQTALGKSLDLGIPSVVDPKRIRFFDFKGTTVFKPNAKELANALGAHLRPDDEAWMESTRRHLECENLLLTLGEEGIALQTEDGRHLRVPAVARSVYDVSGAGDTVTAVTAVALAAGATMVEAAVLANHSAAIEVGKAGVATVSPEEILSHSRVHEEAS